MAQNRINIQQILWEMPAIVLAVFLALAVDNCNENRKEKALADKALEAIVLEIRENQSNLDNNLVANERKRAQMQATRDSLSDREEKANISVSIGYNQIIMSNGAWEMAKLSGAIRRFQPLTIQNLSELYYLQEMYMNLGNDYFGQLASASFHQNKDELPRVDASLNLIKINASIGQAILAGYEAFLKEHPDILERLDESQN